MAAPVPPQLVLMAQGRLCTLVVWGAKPRRGQEKARRALERPKRGPDEAWGQWKGGASHPRCRICVEVDMLEAKKCTRTVFWAPEVSDLR